ncbi:hypothetical protein DFO73_11642 [Cytobacillus oceanisediminis]|uniref:Uncharacterized protein n=1 Tax=Cytobacillus oceanisediminis TaxID=665099 RepID=A0A2V2ZK01_9BACI|nr:hypothetical protein [Cytobacillus oceanisediminis]PWW20228.1 hypothetical protein DFO73_11642 [Cytobacillus oceanisediminis]
MEMKTAKIINNISRLDSEVFSVVLLKLYENISNLYDRIEEESKLENCLVQLGLRSGDEYSKELLKHLGFSEDDEIADEYIYDYCLSTDANRMEVLKKQLIEWIVESAEIEY